MAIYGALGESPDLNGSRRGEYVARGVAVITTNGTINVTVPAPLRTIKHFQLTVDDLGVPADGVTVSKPAFVSGSLNAAATVLTINIYVATDATHPTLIQTAVTGSVRWAMWGAL